MTITAQIILGTLAAVGFICIIKSVYDIIFLVKYSSKTKIFMTIKGNGYDESNEMLFKSALHIKKLYFPCMHIIFVEENNDNVDGTNIAKRFAEYYEIEYIE